MLRSDLQPISQPLSSSTPAPRLCAVHYLNTLPLVWGLRQGQARGRVALSFASPADCAEQLRAGSADLGLVPVAEMARQGLPNVPGTCISSDGPVRSILLVSRVPWEQVRTLAADCNSRTSVVLAQIVLQERFGVRVSVESRPPSLSEMLSRADAALVIGDAALHIDPARLPYHVLDLGEEWRQITGLPMVYAVWAGPAATTSPWLEGVLADSLAHGEANLDAIVKQEAANFGVDPDFARHYLSRHVRFHLGERERAGLEAFLQRGEALGLIVSGEALEPASVGPVAPELAPGGGEHP
ncbi:MAG: menaquinone biosynthesis protein [Bryobacterales bacterium]|nr:menaquinone biosynthesis protein [Bryobacterales bacterium]